MVADLPVRRLGSLVVPRLDKALGGKDTTRPYVGLEHLASGSPDLVGTAAAETSVSTNSVFEVDDILFGKLRPYLRKCVLADFLGYCSTDILVLKARSGVDPRFAVRVFQSEPVVREAVATSIGTKMPRTSWAAIQHLEVFCPPEPEQQRLAQIFDILDDTIRNTEKIIAKLKMVKQGLLHDLLTRGIDETGGLRPPPDHAPHLYKDSPLGNIPRTWHAQPFVDFGASDRPVLKTGPFGSSLKGEHWVDDGIPVITIGALGEGEFERSELLFVSERTAERLSVYQVLPGDVVFSRVADVGRSVVVSARESGWIMSSNLMWISLDSSKANPGFLWLNLNANHVVRDQIRRGVNAGGREVANGPILRALQFAWPDLDEQHRIVTAAASVRDLERAECHRLLKLRDLRSGLSDDLLTGRVRVPVLDEVVA